MTVRTGILHFDSPVLLVGPEDINTALLEDLIRRKYPVIAADGGANRLLNRGITPKAIIGDMDSLDISRKIPPQTELIRCDEQNSCDFEKCLYSVQTPLFLAFGFTGGRLDHTLATLHGMAKYHGRKRVLLLGENDISFVHGGTFSMTSDSQQILSIFPLYPIGFLCSRGLEFPLDGLKLEVGRKIGTSNSSSSRQVQVVPLPEYQNTPYLVSLSNNSHTLENLLESYML